MSAVSVRATLGTCRHADMCRHVRFETLTREFGVVVMVAMTLTLAGCTSSTSSAVTKAANAALAAARSALKAETAAKAAAAPEAAEMSSAQPCTASQLRRWTTWMSSPRRRSVA
jgi:hypothetical protein